LDKSVLKIRGMKVDKRGPAVIVGRQLVKIANGQTREKSLLMLAKWGEENRRQGRAEKG